jgi:hypothetical protein
MKPEQVNQSAERLSALVSAAVLRSRRAASEARRAFDSQDGLALPSDDQLFCGEPSETAPVAGHFFSRHSIKILNAIVAKLAVCPIA